MSNMVDRNCISGVASECYILHDGNRYDFGEAIRLEARFEKIKRSWYQRKRQPWQGLGNMTFHCRTSIFRTFSAVHKDTGQPVKFDIEAPNEGFEDTGRQTVVLKGCTLDCVILAKFDADVEYLEEEIAFSFEDFEILKAL